MKVVRRQAYQGHAVPATAGYPKGPFSPEVLAPPVIDYTPLVDDQDFFPVGATAQNNFRGTPRYQCRLCGDVLDGDQLSTHACEVNDGPY